MAWTCCIISPYCIKCGDNVVIFIKKWIYIFFLSSGFDWLSASYQTVQSSPCALPENGSLLGRLLSVHWTVQRLYGDGYSGPGETEPDLALTSPGHWQSWTTFIKRERYQRWGCEIWDVPPASGGHQSPGGGWGPAGWRQWQDLPRANRDQLGRSDRLVHRLQ